MRSIALTSDQLGLLLNQIATTRDAGTLRKCLSWVELYRGRTVWEVAALLQVSVRSIQRWREELTHRQSRAVWVDLTLCPMAPHAGGRPSRWDEEMDEILTAVLSHRPDQIGYSASSWSAALIQTHLSRWCGETFSPAWIRHQLHRLGYVWKRPRYVLMPDPQRGLKVRKIREKLAHIGKREVVLFEDETDLLLFPPLRSTWAMQGTAVPVLLTGWNEKRVVFGALNVQSGHSLFSVREHNRAQDFISFLKLARAHYRGWKVNWVLDEHPSHRAIATLACARNLDMELIWLPKRSPELNPLDQLWGKAKARISANRQYEDVDTQCDDFVAWLEALSQKQILRLAGVSPKFWLWSQKMRQQFVSPA